MKIHNKKGINLYLLLGFLSLFIGFSIYFYRANSIFYIKDWGFNIRNDIFSSFIFYNFPDGLWLLSGLFFIRAIWFFENKISNAYSLIFLSIAIFLEITLGTFDIIDLIDLIDLIVIILFSLIEYIFYNTFRRQKCY